MSHISIRDLLAFPPGDNSSDTIIEGHHYNLNTLHHWNYSYYSNLTVSNETHCMVFFPPYMPILLDDGSFVNETSCHDRLLPLGARGITDITMFCCFFLILIFTAVNSYIFHMRVTTVTKPDGFLWALLHLSVFLGIMCALVGYSTYREYVVSTSIVGAGILWYLMLLSILATVWQRSIMAEARFEAVRAYNTRQEPPQRTRLPFIKWTLRGVFFALYIVVSILVLIRDWTEIGRQRSPEQTRLHAKPAATNTTFKFAAFFLLVPLGLILFTYDGFTDRVYCRPFFRVALLDLLSPLLLLVLGAYSVATTFVWEMSPFNQDTNLALYYGLGWAPVIIIVLTLNTILWAEARREKLDRRALDDAFEMRPVGNRSGGDAAHGTGTTNTSGQQGENGAAEDHRENTERFPSFHQDRANAPGGDRGTTGNTAGNTDADQPQSGHQQASTSAPEGSVAGPSHTSTNQGGNRGEVGSTGAGTTTDSRTSH